ncbi:uncharacterized protein LOC141915241 [Tubulanus polymorphus]|uniref:uncharacterized protein LOC141915241 n=1 Tax=Tubulanus polymorphus TaxID=672921 RepID=UPI003DA4C67F
MCSDNESENKEMNKAKESVVDTCKIDMAISEECVVVEENVVNSEGHTDNGEDEATSKREFLDESSNEDVHSKIDSSFETTHITAETDDGFEEISDENKNDRNVKDDVSSKAENCLKAEDMETVEKDATESGSACLKMVKDFTENTTLHGLSRVTEAQPYFIRRMIWGMIVLAGLTLFCIQAINSIILFFNRPVSVNVKVNYNESLSFPAVTLCNQNDFRISKIAEMNLYDTLHEFYTTHAASDSEHEDHDKMNLTMSDILNTAAHDVTDFIVSCKWAGSECAHSDFKRIVTDYGVCFTFNHRSNHANKKRLVTQEGTSGGLRLQINVEQYEYMDGPSDGAGLKVLIHSPAEFPLVKYQGQALSPGTHALIGVSILEVNNLKTPYGKCDDSVTLKYFPYSVAACQTECKQTKIREKCKCRDFYLDDSEADEQFPECTIEDITDCVDPILDSLGASDCRCPIPCKQTLYKPLISGGALSDIDRDRLLNRNKTYIHQVTRQFVNAREKRYKLLKKLATVDRQYVTNIIREISVLGDIFSRVDIQTNFILQQINAMKKSFEPYKKVHDNVLAFADYIIRHNVNRGFELRRDRYFQFVAKDYFAFLTDLRVLIGQLGPRYDSQSSFAVDAIITRTLSRLNLVAVSQVKMGFVYRGYIEGKPMSIYKYTRVPKYDALFSALCYFPDPQKSIFDELKIGSDSIISGLNETLALMDGYRNGSILDFASLESQLAKIESGSKKYVYYQFLLSDRIAFKPYEHLKNEIEIFQSTYSDFITMSAQIVNFCNGIKTAIREFSPNEKRLASFVNEANNFLNDPNSSKTEFSKLIISDPVQNAILSLWKVFNEIRIYDQNINDNFNVMGFISDKLTTLMTTGCSATFYGNLTDDLRSYYPEQMNTSTCHDMELVLQELIPAERCDAVRQNTQAELLDLVDVSRSKLDGLLKPALFNLTSASNYRSILGSADALIIDHFQNYKVYFTEYLNASQISTEFIRNNFLNLDIYIAELSYEEITQQIGYSLTNLWSDIGGSMGLCIGASLITAFEIFDALFYGGPIKTRKRLKEKTKESEKTN